MGATIAFQGQGLRMSPGVRGPTGGLDKRLMGSALFSKDGPLITDGLEGSRGFHLDGHRVILGE